MLKKLFLLAVLLATASAATAQADCSKPVLKLLHNGEEISAAGSALFLLVRLQILSEPECPDQVSYRARNAELTLVRGGRPLMPTILVRQPQVDMRPWMNTYQPGDHINVFIAYENLIVVSADGQQRPYVKPLPKLSKFPHFDLRTDDSKGISFTWRLVQK